MELQQTIKNFRDFQKLIAYGFFILAFAFLIGFLFLELSLKSEIWVNYIWMPLFGLGMAFLGMTIENNRLASKLVKIESNPSSDIYEKIIERHTQKAVDNNVIFDEDHQDKYMEDILNDLLNEYKKQENQDIPITNNERKIAEFAFLYGQFTEMYWDDENHEKHGGG